MMPTRIQRRRTRGWRMPEGAVYVGRPSKWGNPFPVGVYVDIFGNRVTGRTLAELRIREYTEALLAGRLAVTVDDVRRELRGRDLMCWCPLPGPGEPDLCHAAVLLRIAAGDCGLESREGPLP
jgi:hypothetical protein